MRALDQPLSEVTFCVVDLETTGGSPLDDRICEIGAVKVRRGEVIGTFETLVNPGRGIPPFVSMLTGLTDVVVAPAPSMDEIVPTVAGFVGDSVLVAHNARFDRAFLAAAFERAGWPPPANPVVDTMTLARRLLRDDVRDHRLDTLANQLRLAHRPTHRAMTDALAACDLLHVLIERSSGLGVRALDDLLALPRQAGHRLAHKLRLTEHLPRGPGVYAFRGGNGEILYVGKATNLRQRVRSYFADGRRSIAPLLHQTVRIDHRSCTSTLEAAVVEARLLRTVHPRFNVAGRPRPAAVVRLDDSAFPRLVAARARPHRGPYLGPMPVGAARLVVEAIESVIPLRRCVLRPPASGAPCRDSPCAPAQIGVATCPCSGDIASHRYAPLAERARQLLEGDVVPALGQLDARMSALAAECRFEEAAMVRDRAAALARAVERRRRIEALTGAGRLELLVPAGRVADVDQVATAIIVDGVLVGADGPRADPVGGLPDPGPPAPGSTDDRLAESACIAAWLDADGHRARLASVSGLLARRWEVAPSFVPARAARGAARGSGDAAEERRAS